MCYLLLRDETMCSTIGIVSILDLVTPTETNKIIMMAASTLQRREKLRHLMTAHSVNDSIFQSTMIAQSVQGT